ncbi:hypothetical protein H5410_026066 [Solanum commersonii]|uniref:Secreted protein n=1 Tax=Solanum commersonii TaxID=4109 RepID=A0A9J5Z0E0_SOLCO|nr:hypothetical protein H5410_026066 [Solanum commersonii]
MAARLCRTLFIITTLEIPWLAAKALHFFSLPLQMNTEINKSAVFECSNFPKKQKKHMQFSFQTYKCTICFNYNIRYSYLLIYLQTK